jgi:tRNA(fMet)-specific endonuclease VapC
MTILSLDTNVLIDVANGRRSDVRQRFDEAVLRGDVLATCSISAHELLYGAAISRRPEVETRTATTLLDQLLVADFTREDAAAAADVRKRLRGLGQGIGTFDTLIAAQALARGWAMVTANVREFGRVAGLSVIDWTRPSAGAP